MQSSSNRLRSPIVYRGQGWFRDAFLDFAERFANRDLIARHYLHLGERQRRVYFGDGKLVPQKKIFYALRPAAALRWLRLHSDQAIAPMHFPTLMDECDPPSEVMKLTADLIARKAVTHELGGGLLPAPIANFIDQEFEIARPLLRHLRQFLRMKLGPRQSVSIERQRAAAHKTGQQSNPLFPIVPGGLLVTTRPRRRLLSYPRNSHRHIAALGITPGPMEISPLHRRRKVWNSQMDCLRFYLRQGDFICAKGKSLGERGA